MKALLWSIIAGLLVLAFAGDKLRGYFKNGEPVVAEQPAIAGGTSGKASIPRSDSDPRSSTGPYVPSPGDAPELYESPTRRLGL